jgi:uncharacterized membrane protein YhfC
MAVIVLEGGVHAWLGTRNPIVDPVMRAVLAASIAGLFEEPARAAGLAWLGRRHAEGNRGFLAFAVGYAVAELFVVGVLGHARLLALASDPARMQLALGELPGPVRESLARALAGLSRASVLALIVERTAAFLLQLLLALLVWRALRARRWPWLAGAIALHVAMDLPAALWQEGLLGLAAVETVYGVAGLVAASFLWNRLRNGRGGAWSASAP